MTRFVKFVGNLCQLHGQKRPKTQIVLAGVFVPVKRLISELVGQGDKNDPKRPLLICTLLCRTYA